MARENEYLKAFQGQHVLAVGEKGTKKVSVKGLKPSTKYTDMKVAYDYDNSNSLSKRASEATSVPEFTTKTPVVNVTGVTLDKTTLSLDTGKKAQLVATVAPSNATNKAVTWSSSDTAVATVDGSGNVTGVKAGSATITVKTTDQGKTASAKVTVTAKPAPEPDPPTEG